MLGIACAYTKLLQMQVLWALQKCPVRVCVQSLLNIDFV